MSRSIVAMHKAGRVMGSSKTIPQVTMANRYLELAIARCVEDKDTPPATCQAEYYAGVREKLN